MSDEQETPDGSGMGNQLATLDAISHLLTETVFDLEPLLYEIVRIAAQKLGVMACSIRLLDQASGELVLKAVYGLSEQYLTKGPVFAAESAYRRVISKGEVIRIRDIREEPWRKHFENEADEAGIRSRLSVGLLRDGKVIGALSVYTASVHDFGDAEVQTFETVANQATLAIHLARLHKDRIEIQRLEQELEIAAGIQAHLNPSHTPQIPGIQIGAVSRASEEVGGDFFDFIELPGDNLGIAIGDASGKGIPAALLMSSVATGLRVQTESVYSIGEIVGRLNRTICHHTRQEQFATVFYGVLNATDRMLTYVNAGHDYPVILRKGEQIPLKVGGRPPGIYPESTYKEERVQLEPNDVLVMYTDGFVDVFNADEEIFGEERLFQAIHQLSALDPDDIIWGAQEALLQFQGAAAGPVDDRTMIVVKIGE